MPFDWNTLDDKINEFKEEAQSRNKRTPFNFYLQKNAKSRIVFLTNDLLVRYEHEFFVKGMPPLSIPCLREREGDSCPMCDYRDLNRNGPVGNRTLVGYTTVLQLETIKAGNGKEYKNPRRMIRMKSSTLDALKLIWEENDNNLVGLVVTAKRSGEGKSPGVGDTWLPSNKRMTLEDIKAANPEQFEPYNWDEELPTWNLKEIETELRRYAGIGQSRTENRGNSDDGEDTGPETW